MPSPTTAVAVADDGRALVAWTASAPGRRGVVVRIRTGPDGLWSAPQRIATDPPQPGGRAVAAIGEDGRRVVAWRSAAGLRVLVRVPAASRFAAAPAPPAAREFVAPAIAVASGRVVLAWVEHDAAGRWTARRATLRAGAWDPDPPLDLVASGVVSDPAAPAAPVVALGRDGDTAVAWPGATVSADQERVVPVRAVVRRGRVGGAPGDFRWEAPQTLSAAGRSVAVAAGPARQATPAGHLLATWVEGARVVAAVRDPTAAAFAAPERIGDVPGGAGFPAAAVNEEGYAAVAWGAFATDGVVVRARLRSGASGLWGPERDLGRLDSDAILRLRAMRVAIDRRRIASIAWPDPQGPGSASVLLGRLSAAGVQGPAVEVQTGENTDDFALGAGSAGATLVARRTAPDSEPNVDLVATVVGAPGRVALTAGQLLTNQRIAQAALRRANAALERLWAVSAYHVRDGSVGAADLGPAIAVTGTAGGSVPAGPITPLAIVPARPGGTVTATAAQLLVGQRIAQAAVRRANAGRTVLGRGLGGANVVDGQISAAKLAPGLTITGTTPSTRPPVGAFPPRDVVPRPPMRLALSVAQLIVNQRVAQEAVLRAGWLVERLNGGLTGADLQDGGLDPVDLEPSLRS